MLLGLKDINDKNIVHLDIKPNNILYKKNKDNTLSIYYIDFGISKTFDKKVIDFKLDDYRMTKDVRIETNIWQLGYIIIFLYKYINITFDIKHVSRSIKYIDINNLEETLSEWKFPKNIKTMLLGIFKLNYKDRIKVNEALELLN